ncbi:MAG: 6-phosphofructokinase, partial [Thermodesulfovibrionales bacterium]
MGFEFERSIETDYFRTTVKAGYAVSSNMEFLLSVPYLAELDQDITDFEDVSVGLTPDDVATIHNRGGTILGSSRGHGERSGEIVDTLEKMNMKILFTIGGDGTQQGA